MKSKTKILIGIKEFLKPDLGKIFIAFVLFLPLSYGTCYLLGKDILHPLSSPLFSRKKVWWITIQSTIISISISYLLTCLITILIYRKKLIPLFLDIAVNLSKLEWISILILTFLFSILTIEKLRESWFADVGLVPKYSAVFAMGQGFYFLILFFTLYIILKSFFRKKWSKINY